MSIRYSAIVLDDESRQLLLDRFNDRIVQLLDQGWMTHNNPQFGTPERLPHHMTIKLGPLIDEERDVLGSWQEMLVYAWGQSSEAAAVMVHSKVKSQNAITHITMAISPTGKPYDSNQIVHWEVLSDPFYVGGIVQQVS